MSWACGRDATPPYICRYRLKSVGGKFEALHFLRVYKDNGASLSHICNADILWYIVAYPCRHKYSLGAGAFPLSALFGPSKADAIAW